MAEDEQIHDRLESERVWRERVGGKRGEFARMIFYGITSVFVSPLIFLVSLLVVVLSPVLILAMSPFGVVWAWITEREWVRQRKQGVYRRRKSLITHTASKRYESKKEKGRKAA